MGGALHAIGEIVGLAGIGAVIDFAMSKAQRDRLKAALEHWWLQFDYIRWGNFGRKEAGAAIAFLDRWAGPRLWSSRRWYFSLTVTVVAACLALALACAILLWFWPKQITQAGTYSTAKELLSRWGVPIAIGMPGMMCGLALSISYNRLVANIVAGACKGTLVDAILILCVILFHWIVFAIWANASAGILFFLPAIFGLFLLDYIGIDSSDALRLLTPFSW